MKKVLFFLLVANSVLAQTDTITVKTDSAKTVYKDEVIINATRATENSPTAYQFVTKKELNKNNLGQDLPFLLDNTASVVTTSDAGAGIGYTGIRIRGSDATRVNVTLNGIPVNDAESQGVFWVNTPDLVSSAQSIQIQRGIGSSTNGGSAFGGSLSVQTQTPSATPFGEAGVSVGSFRTFRGNIKAGTGLIKKHFFLEGSGSWIVSNGYVDRASSNLQSWFFQTGYTSEKTLLKLLYFGGREKTYQSWYGVWEDSLKVNRTYNVAGTDYGYKNPAYENQTDNYGQDYLQLLFTQQLPQHLHFNAGLFATLGRGYYEEYKAGADIQNYYTEQPGAYTDLVRQLWLNNVFYGGNFALNYKKDEADVTFGSFFGQYRGKHFGKVIWAQDVAIDKDRHYYNGSAVKNDFNVYAKANYEVFDVLNLYVDAQYRYVGYATSGTDNNWQAYDVKKAWHFFNPKVGMLYKIDTKHQVYASYALGNREPNRDDVLQAYFSNRTIKPEMMDDIEAGYKFLHPKFPFNANFYFMNYNNQLVLTGRLTDVGNPIKENVKKSFRTGIELNGSFHFTRKGKVSEKIVPRDVFSINYSFTYSFNKIKSFDEVIYTYDENYSRIDTLTQVITHKNTDIAFSPSIIASLELVVRPLKGLSIGLQNKAVSKQYLDNTSDENRKLKPFFYSNLNVSYSVPLNKAGKEITLKVLFNNIFNRLYESNGYTFSERYAYNDGSGNLVTDGPYTYNYYYPQAGFNFLTGINVRF
jgi:iron complex outermembrane receptor protein